MITTPLKQMALAAAVLAATALTQPAQAQVLYTDATGEVMSGVTHSNEFDIVSVEVSNTSFDLIFDITLVGDPVAYTGAKYCIGFDTRVGGATNNAWGRHISMSQGMDFWLGSWVDGGGGANLSEYDDFSEAWGGAGSGGVSTTTNSVRLTVPYLPMGLSAGDTFEFDVYATGGGGSDGAIDALANPNQTVSAWSDWYDSSTNLANPPKMYTLAASADPTNHVTFLLDMGVPIALFDADFSDKYGFDTNSDSVYVRGDFNGWPDPPGAEYQLLQVGPTLFSNTVDIVIAPGSMIHYKFYGLPFPDPHEENVLLSCNDTRQLEITSQNVSAPLAYWSDRALSDPTIDITFSVDMSLQELLGNFSNGADLVYLRGYITQWGDRQILMTNNPAPDTNIYSAVASVPYMPVGACNLEYKFFGDPNPGWENPISTGGANRTFSVESTNQTLPTVFWNDQTLCDVLGAETQVTFSIDMTGAVSTGGTNYTGSETVYINGNFLDWWGWGNPGPAEYAMTKNPTSDVHSITLPIPAGNNLQLVYKYSLLGDDNEAGFGVNHSRFIRTDMGSTNYSMPQDVWINTNPDVSHEESLLGPLVIAPSSPGNIQLSWEGLPCTMLQSSTNIAGAWTDLFEARGVGSTNMATAESQQYFRLFRP